MDFKYVTLRVGVYEIVILQKPRQIESLEAAGDKHDIVTKGIKPVKISKRFTHPALCGPK